MNTSEIWGMMDVLILAFGVYAVYAAGVLKKEGRIIKTFLVFKDTDVESCRDLQGYANLMAPKLRTFGMSMVAYGIIAFLNDYVLDIGTLYMVGLGIFVLVLIWYGMEVKKAMKEYF